MVRQLNILIITLLVISGGTMMLMAQDDQTPDDSLTCDTSVDYAISAREAAMQNNFADAIALYTCAIERDPANAILFGGRGLAHMLSGELVAAVTDYQRYEDLTGSLAPFMQTQINRFFITTPPFMQEAVDAQAGIADTAEAHYARGLQYVQQGAYENAILDFNRAIALEPNNADYYGARGLTYVQFGAPDFALIDFQSYERLTGTLQPFMVQLMENMNTPAEDTPLGAQSESEAPAIIMGDANSYFQRGLYYLQNDNTEQAILDFNVATGLDPQQTRIFAARGFAYVLLNEPTLALRDYERYYALTGDYTPFMQQQLPALQRLVQAQNETDAEQSSG
ncbi:MAG: tetratricopeptide repeat protein [Aggregatilineales bacterium]